MRFDDLIDLPLLTQFKNDLFGVLNQSGGRNLVLATGTEVTETVTATTAKMMTNFWLLSDYAKQQINDMKLPKVAVSFEAKSTMAGDKMVLNLRTATSSQIGYSGMSAAVLTTSWARYTGILTRGANADNYTLLRLWGTKTGKTTSSTIYIRNVKLERGIFTSDWVPAPED